MPSHTHRQIGGHYTCYARHRTNQWLHFNDDRVSKVDKGDVITPAAYLLVYVRKDAMPIPHDVLFPRCGGGRPADVEAIRRVPFTPPADAAARAARSRGVASAGPCVVM